MDPAGAPILLLHGLASNARLWDGPARCLSTLGHHVVAVDLRGHGHSDKPSSGYSPAEIADDVAHLIGQFAMEHQHWRRPLVIGQSWGGNVVVQLAAQHRELTRGIVAVDGGTIELSRAFPDWDECERALRPPQLAGLAHDRLRSYIKASHPDWSEEAIDGQMHNMHHNPDGTITPHLSLENHLTILRHLWEHSPSSLWPSIEVPVMFVPAAKGDDDHVRMKRRQVDDALASLPNARAHWFEPADHDLHAQYPDRFAAVVHDAITNGFFP